MEMNGIHPLDNEQVHLRVCCISSYVGSYARIKPIHSSMEVNFFPEICNPIVSSFECFFAILVSYEQ